MSIEKIARKMIEDKHFNLDHVNCCFKSGWRAVHYNPEIFPPIGGLYDICIMKDIETGRITGIDFSLRDWE